MKKSSNLKNILKAASKTILFTSMFTLFYASQSSAAVNCTDPGVGYSLCGTGTITQITYRKNEDKVLIAGVPAPGCGPAGWTLSNVNSDAGAKQTYATLLAAYMSGKTVTLSRVGNAGCYMWDGVWSGNITEISLD